MNEKQIILITGTSKGIGRFLAEYYLKKNFLVLGCSRTPIDFNDKHYQHFCLDVSNEKSVKQLFRSIRKIYQRLDILLNNAGIASMNHFITTPLTTVEHLLSTNFIGTFLFCREAAKLMKKKHFGRIVNFSTVATPLRLEGEAIYASIKAAIETFTRIIAKEVGNFGITVNAIGPSPIKTDLIKNVPQEKIEQLIHNQAIKRIGTFQDVANVIDFFIKKESDFITGQIIYLGGI